MYTFIVILILIVCVLLSLVVLMQNSKGGGLAANFSAPNQIMGVRKTTDVFEKATWILAAALIVLCLIAAIVVRNSSSEVDARMENKVSADNTILPAAQPAPAANTIEMPAEEAQNPEN